MIHCLLFPYIFCLSKHLPREVNPLQDFVYTHTYLKGQSMTDFRSRFFFSLKSLLTLGKYEWPKKNRPRYDLGGPTAPFMCSSYCKQAPPTVNTPPPTVNTPPPTVNIPPPTVND